MSHTPSPSTQRPYGVVRVCQEWGLSRSTCYQQRGRATTPPVTLAKRGPKTAYTDEDLTGHIRQVLAASPFLGEGHRKVWARLRAQGIRTSNPPVLWLMRQACLLATSRMPRMVGPRVHDGTITRARPNQMWGTDATSTVTVEGGASRSSSASMIVHSKGLGSMRRSGPPALRPSFSMISGMCNRIARKWWCCSPSWLNAMSAARCSSRAISSSASGTKSSKIP